jgi:hypothetical protein
MHVLLLFVLVKIWRENNLIKLIFLTIYLLLLISIYLGMVQLELFGCFLFVSEFIILLFFYCLILNLNLKLRFNVFKINYVTINLIYAVLFLFFLIIVFLNKTFLFNNFNELYINFYNLYKLYNNFVLNDLVFFFQNFFHYNAILFVLVGVILLLVTFVILYFIMLYHFIVFYKRVWLLYLLPEDAKYNTIFPMISTHKKFISYIRKKNYKTLFHRKK